jgi:hypothetical protein
MIPLAFIDTETTGVHPDRRVWEVAIIRRESDGSEFTWLWQVDDVDLSNADPFGLKVGGFYERHVSITGGWDGPHEDYPVMYRPESHVAKGVEKATRGAHLVGAVPNFDADVLDKMLRRHRLIPAWHYHLIDVEAMAVGWLAAKVSEGYVFAEEVYTPPWKSDDLSRDCGVKPPTNAERHTALGDARWVMRWYDAMTGGKS